MINEYTYQIGMTVISYMIVIFLLAGFVFIQICKHVMNDEYESEEHRITAEFAYKEYINGNFTSKVAIIFKYGGLLISLITVDILKAIFTIFKGGRKK